MSKSKLIIPRPFHFFLYTIFEINKINKQVQSNDKINYYQLNKTLKFEQYCRI